MNDIVKKIQDSGERERWETEANKWRLPYWDWALEVEYDGYKGMGLPELCTKDQIQIVMPGKKDKVWIPNPFAGYKGDGMRVGDPDRKQYAIKRSLIDHKDGIYTFYPVSGHYVVSISRILLTNSVE